jgi:hypothetical protein
MVPYFLMIDHVLSSNSQVLACVIPTMERSQGGISAFFILLERYFGLFFVVALNLEHIERGYLYLFL